MQSKQNNNKNNSYKRLKLILGNETVQKIKQLTILLVGVGGIGCQVLKNLTKMPIKKIVIIDLDTIQTSNLNRQFYFHTQHVGKPKSFIAAQQIKKLLPQISIQPLYGSIYQPQYNNYRFYQQFDYVISALDSLKVRQYVAQKCTEYGKVLIDAGTSGFHGQSYTSVRFLSGCHNCHPLSNNINTQTQSAVCTIRSQPQKPIHCAIYAKYIFEQLFTIRTNISSNTNNNNNDYQQQQKQQSMLIRIRNKLFLNKQTQLSQQQSRLGQIGIQLFDYLFHGQFIGIIQHNNNNNSDSHKKQEINLITYQQAVNDVDIKRSQQQKYPFIYTNIKTTTTTSIINNNKKQNINNNNIENNQHLLTTILTPKQYTQLFIVSFTKLALRILQLLKKNQLNNNNINPNNLNQIQKIIYDKDDFYSNLFITSVCNLRVYNFLSIKKSNNHLKYLSYYDIRTMIGKIIPAIASTNSIAGALQVKQIIDLISINNNFKQSVLKYYTISPYTNQKLSYSWLSLPNPQCTVCSPINFYYHIKCDLSRRTFYQLQQFTYEKCFSYNRDVYCQNLIIVKNINTNKQSPNKKKLLNFKPQLLIKDTLTIQYFPVKKLTDLKVRIILINEEQQQTIEIDQNKNEKIKQKFIILNQRQIQQTLKALEIFRQRQRKKQQRTFMNKKEFEICSQQDQQPLTEIN